MKKPLAGLAVLLAVGATAGFFGYRWYAARESLQAPVPQGESPATATAPPAEPGAAAVAGEKALLSAERRVPHELPALRLADLAGKTHSLRDYVGRPLLLNFWATWCEPCRREIPLLNALPGRYAGDRLQVVGIAIDQADSVREYLHRLPIDYPLLVDEEQGLAAASSFGMEPVLPFSVFADAGGRVLAVKIGELHADDADAILSALRAYSSGKLELPAARRQIDETLKTLATRRAKSRV